MKSWRTSLLLAAALGAALSPSVLAAPNPDARQSAAPAAQISPRDVYGVVFQDDNRDGQRGDKELGLADLKVRLVGWKRTLTAQTDADGTFSFAGLAEGGYRLELELPERASATTENLELRVPLSEPAPVLIGVGAEAPAIAEVQSAPATPESEPDSEPALATPESEPSPGAAQSTESSQTVPAEPDRPTEQPVATPDAAAAASQVETDAAPLQALGSLSAIRPVTELRFARGRDVATQVSRKVMADGTLWLGVPFRSQVDGTMFQSVNCGPASLSMVLSAFGLDVTPSDIRDFLNWRIDNYDTDAGTSLEDLASIARLAGATPLDLYGPTGFRNWSTDAIRWHVEQGNPVITLVKYRELPGRQASNTDFDHYVVITGTTPGGFIFNDPAFANDTGYGLAISERELEQAWHESSIPRQALALGVGSDAATLSFPFPTPLVVRPSVRDDWALDVHRSKLAMERTLSGSRFLPL